MIVLFEDNHLLAVNKPAGMLSQSDGSGVPDIFSAAKVYIKEKYAKPGEVYLGLVHRLDRNVGGVMLFARTSKAAARLSKAFREHELRKIYTAIVDGRPPAEGERTDLLRKDQKRRMALIVPPDDKKSDEAREARLRFRLLKSITPPEGAIRTIETGNADKEISLVEIELLTGRFHQIRAQLAAMGHPILGDRKYGARRTLKNWTLALFASRLDIEHPVRREPLILQAEPPWGVFA